MAVVVQTMDQRHEVEREVVRWFRFLLFGWFVKVLFVRHIARHNNAPSWAGLWLVRGGVLEPLYSRCLKSPCTGCDQCGSFYIWRSIDFYSEWIVAYRCQKISGWVTFDRNFSVRRLSKPKTRACASSTVRVFCF
jgi:hypothetical protein